MMGSKIFPAFNLLSRRFVKAAACLYFMRRDFEMRA